MKIRRKIIWGVFCILAAVALIVNQLGYFKGIGFWNILFSIIFIGICMNGIIKKSWSKILFSIAFFVIINAQLLHLEDLPPWIILGAALLCTIGLNMIFPLKHSITKKLFKESVNIWDWNEADEQLMKEDGEVIQQDVVFGNCIKYVKSQELSGINADCVFGAISIYLTEAQMKNDRAKIYMDVVFGNANIYVPASWTVSVNMDNVFGRISSCGKSIADGEKKLLICGDVVFGEVLVHYV